MAEKIDKQAEVYQIGCNCKSRSKRGEDLGPLEMELANSYYWSGSLCKDYWFFVCNWHPLLGLLMSHPAHPWSKLERLATFMFSACFSLMPIALQLQGGRRGKLKGNDAEAQAKLLLYVSLPLMLWEFALYWINIMDIYCRGRCFEKCGRAFKNIILLISVAGGAFFAWIAIAVILPEADEPLSRLLGKLLNSRVQMWIVWFPLYFFAPFIGFLPVWCKEKKKASEVSEDAGAADVETGSVPASEPVGVPIAATEAPPAVSAQVITLCDVCGKTRQEHPNHKFCRRPVAPSVHSVTLCDVCGKPRNEHPDHKFCKR